MDVRAMDTSHLAAKRVEVDHGKPVKEKPGFVREQIATHTAAEANGQVNRPRPPKDPHEGHESHPHERPAPDTAIIEDEEVQAQPSDGEQHILDVRV